MQAWSMQAKAVDRSLRGDARPVLSGNYSPSRRLWAPESGAHSGPDSGPCEAS
jgi:hypothetical protein